MSALVWIRNDLRFLDNPAISSAVSLKVPAVLVYVLNAEEIGKNGQIWLKQSLYDFGRRAKSRGFGWVVRRGDPEKILKQIQRETNATHILWNQRVRGHEQDLIIQKRLEDSGTKVSTYPPNLLVEPQTILNQQGKPYRLFTPFWKSLQAVQPNSTIAPDTVPAKKWNKQLLSSKPLVTKAQSLKQLTHWTPGEEGALRLLKRFCTDHIQHYHKQRDIPEPCVTSMLSPHLHFGEISVRYIWKSVCKNPRSESFLRQLGWRDFTHSILYHFPHVADSPFRDNKRAWRKNKHELLAWKQGMTGVPIVDAGMRQLQTRGWMHNRVRMIVASFLVKHLLHDWKEGAEWFWHSLFDADVANNSFGWQWIADCGADSAPWYRIFNPVTQGERFDPQGRYVRKYVEELIDMPDKYIHRPWEAPEKGSYPNPIVDLRVGRERALQSRV